MKTIKYFFIIVSLFSLELHALSLEDIINKALEKNPSLKAIKNKISATKYTTLSSDAFYNPNISYTQNTLSPNEPMSQKNLTLSQKISFYGKRDALEDESKAYEEVLNESLKDAQAKLVRSIKDEAYNIWELNALYKIIEQYEEITKQNIALAESYTSTTPNQHMGIMSAELSLTDLKVQKSTLKAKISSAYAKLSYLASFEVKNLELELFMDKNIESIDRLKSSLSNNHTLLTKDKEIKKAQAIEQSANLNNYPDITLLAGFSYREKFTNFWNLGVVVNLPIYGSEDYKEQESKQLTLATQSLKDDVNISINSQFKATYAQMRSSYEIYKLIQDEALPQIKHMFELSSSSISTGADLFKYIDILIQKLKLEQKSINALASYYRYKAKISELSGELK